MRARGLRYAVGALALLTLAGCSDEQPAASPGGTGTSARPTGPSDSGSSGSSPTTEDPGISSSAGTTASTEGAGTAADPAVLEPGSAPLDWRPVPGPVREVVTRSSDWTLRVASSGRSWELEGGPATAGSASGGGSAGSGASGGRVSDALLDGRWAVVVLQDPTEQHPSTADVTDLRTGHTFRIDGSSDVPTTNGGTWALGDDTLLHATVGPGGAYCLASVDLTTRRSSLRWCAPKRHGFNGARTTEAGTTLLTFDDGQPSCRTPVTLDGDQVTPLPDVPRCQGWDAALLDDGAIWSVTPQPRRIEEAHFYARSGDSYADLGAGTSGSLVTCGSAAYFVRDPQRAGDHAALMRWSPTDGLTTAYEAKGRQGFLDAPRCGGDALTVTALTSAGDEQVTAPVE